MIISFITIISSLVLVRYVGVYFGTEKQKWLQSYFLTVHHKARTLPQLMRLALLILPIGLLVGLFYLAFGGGVGYAGRFGLGLLTLTFCLATEPFFHTRQSFFLDEKADEDVKHLILDEERADIQDVPFSPHLSAIVWGFNEQVFALLFWYAVLGPLTAWIYFTTVKLHKFIQQAPDDFKNYQVQVRLLLDVLLWLPSRLLALGYMLAGDFSAGVAYISRHLFAGLESTRGLLIGTSLSAGGFDEDSSKQASIEEQKIVLALSDRCLVVLLGMYALAVIFSLG